jgi:hypothetical protein
MFQHGGVAPRAYLHADNALERPAVFRVVTGIW